MKKYLLAVAVSLFAFHCFSQIIVYQDTISFEGGLHNIVIDTPTVNNIWQVGNPSKGFFNSAHSPSNVMITDTVNPYPPNNHSSFTFFEPFQGINTISFWHKYDATSGHAGGYIEISLDHGLTWTNIISDTILQNYYFVTYTWGLYDSTQKISNSIPAFTGKSNGWANVGYRWDMICLSPFFPPFDTIGFRFNFKSDSVQSEKGGWMIDDIYYAIDFCTGVEENHATGMGIYPNPLTTASILRLNTPLKNAEVVIFDILGKEIMRKKFTGDRMEIERGSMESGVYVVKVTEENKHWVGKIIIE